MIEWSKQAKFNSFNSDKGLCFYEHYNQIMEWMNEKTDYLPPPIEVNLDPYAECNLACTFCVGQRYLRNHREEVGEMRKLPTDYMLRLVRFLAEWGVPGLCISGGGEPTLHPDLPVVIQTGTKLGMDTAVVTNMVQISENLAQSLLLCRWVAMSVDAGTPETYHTVKGRDYFNKVIANIAHLANLQAIHNAKVDLAYKMVVLPENIPEIHKACKLAKELGVRDFHVRPVDLERDDIEGHKKLQLDMAKIEEQFALCHEEETESFRVFTITHKFDKNFHNKQDFTRCLMTPILLPILTDGNSYICVDKKMQSHWKLGSAFPNPETILSWWGSPEHRNLIKSVCPKTDCVNNRCTGQAYNQQIEQVVLKDSLCLSFP